MTLTNGNAYAYQWDVGLSVATDDPVGTEVRFANKHGSKSIPVLAVQDGDDVVYKIPNILLTTGRDIIMYSLDGEGESTEHIVAMDELVVYEAQKPDDYVWTDAELRIWDSKLDEPYIEGADGDVLHTDGDGGRYWDGIDYEDIENTPYIPEKTSDLTNDSGFITAEDIPYIPENTSDLTNDSGFITESDIPPIPGKTSDLVNDSGFITLEDIPASTVQSVNGQTGAVVLDASDVGALPDDTVVPTKTSDLTNDSGFITSSDIPAIPSKTSDLTNDSGFLTAETDPTVPAWAKSNSKPTYTASEVGAIADPSTKSNGQVLTWDGSAWVAAAGGGGGIFVIDATLGTPAESANVIVDAFETNKTVLVNMGVGYTGVLVTISYSSTPYDGVTALEMAVAAPLPPTTQGTLTCDFITYTWDGSDWSFAVTSHTVGSGIPAPSSPTAGQYLSWNGSAWVATSLPIWNGGVT